MSDDGSKGRVEWESDDDDADGGLTWESFSYDRHMRQIWYNMSGEPCSMDEWSALFSLTDARRIGNTRISDNVSVSTVWLGLDHGFMDDRPLIFETMVFGGPLDGEMDRYTTVNEARDGHEMMVARAKAAQTDG